MKNRLLKDILVLLGMMVIIVIICGFLLVIFGCQPGLAFKFFYPVIHTFQFIGGIGYGLTGSNRATSSLIFLIFFSFSYSVSYLENISGYFCSSLFSASRRASVDTASSPAMEHSSSILRLCSSSASMVFCFCC